MKDFVTTTVLRVCVSQRTLFLQPSLKQKALRRKDVTVFFSLPKMVLSVIVLMLLFLQPTLKQKKLRSKMLPPLPPLPLPPTHEDGTQHYNLNAFDSAATIQTKEIAGARRYRFLFLPKIVLIVIILMLFFLQPTLKEKEWRSQILHTPPPPPPSRRYSSEL